MILSKVQSIYGVEYSIFSEQVRVVWWACLDIYLTRKVVPCTLYGVLRTPNYCAVLSTGKCVDPSARMQGLLARPMQYSTLYPTDMYRVRLCTEDPTEDTDRQL